MVKAFLNKMGHKLIRHQVNQQKLPSFDSSHLIRMSLNFDGKVQGVGFRVEIAQLAKRLEITGWVKNLFDSTVEAEIQGEKEKIDYLIDSLENHKRITIDRIDKKIINVKENEKEFEIIF